MTILPPQSLPVAAGRRQAVHRTALTPVKDPLRMMLVGLIIISISKIHAYFSLLAMLRPAMMLAILSLLYAWMNPHHLITGSILRTWPAKVVTGLALMACASVPFGISMGGSAMFILTEYDKTLLLGFLLIAAIRTARDLYTVVWGYVIASGFLCWLSIFVFHTSRGRSGTGIERISSGYSYDANDIGLVTLIGFALTLLVMQSASKKGKMICVVILLMMGGTLAKTGSRGAFLGMLCVGGVLFAMVRTISWDRKIAAVLAVGVALVFTAPEGYWDQMKTMLHPTTDYNYTSETGRKEITKRGIGYMLSHPITGIGIDNFQRAEGTIADIAVAAHEIGDGVRWNAAHDTLLQAAAEMGIPGLILMVSLVYGGIYQMYKLKKRLPKEWEHGDPEQRFLYQSTLFLMVAMVAFGTSGVFVSFAYLDPIYILAAYMAGLYTAIEAKLRSQGGGAPVPQGRRRRGGLVPPPSPVPPVAPRPPIG